VDAVAEPFEAVRLSRLHETGTDDQHIVVPLRHALEAVEPDLAQASLDPISLDCTADRTRHGKPDARLARLLLRQPVENEGARGNRAAAAMHRIEVPGTGQAVGALHGEQLSGSVPPSRLRGEASPTLAAATLQDGPAGLRRHARTEAVLALAAADVGLVGALHDCGKARLCQKNPRGSRGAAGSIAALRPPVCPQPPTAQRGGSPGLPPP